MTAISLENLTQTLLDKHYTGSNALIETTYKDLSLPWARHYLGATDLESLALKIEIAREMGYLPVGDVQIQMRSAVKSANSDFYKHLFVQAVEKASA